MFPFMKERIQNFLDLLEEQIEKDRLPIVEIRLKKGNFRTAAETDADPQAWRDFHPGDRWSGMPGFTPELDGGLRISPHVPKERARWRSGTTGTGKAGSRGWAWELMSDLAIEQRVSGSMDLYDSDLHAAQCNESIGNRVREMPACCSQWNYRVVKPLERPCAARIFSSYPFCPAPLMNWKRMFICRSNMGFTSQSGTRPDRAALCGGCGPYPESAAQGGFLSDSLLQGR